jgi:cyclase
MMSDMSTLPPPELVEVTSGVFGYIQPDGSWMINNTGVVTGRDGAYLLVDTTSTEARNRALLEAVEKISPDAPRALVNTHHHGDHTYGNFVFSPATIVAQENCRAELLAYGFPGNTGVWEPVDWGEVRVAPPNLTFADRVRLWSDDRPIDVSYVGQAAHTSNDSLVWLPEQEVLFCGDLLFNGGTPFLLMGSVRGAIEVLESVVAPIPARVIVPGHGAPCDHALIGTVVGYLQFVLVTAEKGIDAGLSPLDLARETDLGEYDGWLDRERIVGNLHRAYADLGAVDQVDLRAALADMVTFNGGQPLSCYA